MPTIKEVTEVWKQYDSIRATAKHFGISEGCVRKALITEGLYASPVINRIADLRERGLKPPEIAEQLGISTTAVNANMPYEKGTYLNPVKSKNAIKIRKTREKKRNAENAEQNSEGTAEVPAHFPKFIRLKSGERGVLIHTLGEIASYRISGESREIRKEDIEHGWD